MNDLPKRCWEMRIKIGGDTWDDVMRELDEIFYHVRDHGPECKSVGGGGSSGHCITIDHNPEQTNEKYFEQVAEYRAKARYERERKAIDLEAQC